MKILLVSSTYHPTIGGAESYARMVAEGLAGCGHEVVVLTDQVPGASATEVIGGVTIHRAHEYELALARADRVRWEQLQFALLADGASAIADRDFELIHANSFEAAILGSMLALELDVPLVCTFHEQSPEDGPVGAGRTRLVYRVLPVDLFLPGSEFYRDKAIAAGAQPERVVVIYHGIDVHMFRPADGAEVRSSLGFGAADIVIGCAARITPRKGLLFLVRAMVDVIERVPAARAVIAGTCNSGSTRYLDDLRSAIASTGAEDRISVVTHLTLDDMPGFYAASDLVVQPSLAEGLGLAALEAMACRRPVIASDIPGLREVITHDVDGLLVPPQDPGALAQAILRLLGDPRARERLATAGRATVLERFSSVRMLTSIEDVHRRVATGWSGPR